jgi:hypothetical protein
MPPEIEQITDGSVSAQEPLRLFYRFESSHPSLSYPSRLVRLLSPIIGVMIRNMYRFRHHFPMRYRVATQLVRHDLPGFAAMISQ